MLSDVSVKILNPQEVFSYCATINVSIAELAARNGLTLKSSETQKAPSETKIVYGPNTGLFGLHKAPQGALTIVYNRRGNDPVQILKALKVNHHEVADTEQDLNEIKAALQWRATPRWER